MKLLWLDLETTGLDPNKHTILEVACGLAHFDRPFEFSVSVDTDDYQAVAHFDIFRWGTDASNVDKFVFDMHTKNGLWAKCAASEHSLDGIEQQLIEMLGDPYKPLVGDDRPILAGSTIGFDLSFLRVHMPRLAARLHYRLYDVTSVKLFCQSLGMPKPPKAEARRAMPDVLESIAHAKACRDWLAAHYMGLYATTGESAK